MIVIDASILSTALADDGAHGRSLREQLFGEDLIAPAIIDLEVASVFSKGLHKQLLTEHRVAFAMVDLMELPMERVPHVGLLRRIWELHHNVTPYDAAYIALAELFQVPLWTGDARMSRAPNVRCEIKLIQ